MRRIATVLGLLGVFLGAGAARAAEEDAGLTQIAVLDIRAKGTVDPAQVEGLSSLIASEVASLGRFTVITSSDMKEMLGFEAQQQLLGCTEGTSCLAEIGGALGVDRLLSTEVSQVGSTWLLTLVLLDIGEAKAAARLTRKTTEEGLVDASTSMVREILAPEGGGPGDETKPPPPDRDPPSEPKPAAPARPGALHLDVGLGTQLPLGVGLGAVLELPYRLQVALGLSIIPGPYGRFITKISLTDVDVPERYEILEIMLKNRALLQLSVGWRPVASLGLEIQGGWSLITGGYSRVILGQVVRAYSEIGDLPGLLENHEMDVKGKGHALHLRVSWRFALGDFYLRPALGYLFVVKSSPDLKDNFPPTIDGNDWDQAAENAMQDDFKRTKAYHLGLFVGYRIF